MKREDLLNADARCTGHVSRPQGGQKLYIYRKEHIKDELRKDTETVENLSLRSETTGRKRATFTLEVVYLESEAVNGCSQSYGPSAVIIRNYSISRAVSFVP